MTRTAAQIALDLHTIADEHGGWVADVCREAALVLAPTPDTLFEVVPAEDVAVAGLCTRLADAVEAHRGTRPKVTARWVKDMGLLLRRGPLHRDEVGPLPAEDVDWFIGQVFTTLASPSRSGFCWADQIRSPHAMRDHWDQVLLALQRKAPATQWDDVVAGVEALRAVL